MEKESFDLFEPEKVMLPRMVAAVSYQGGKGRLAEKIVDHFNMQYPKFYDLCCGSGAVSIEMVNRGYNPYNITMADKGPWGKVWESIGEGSFDVGKFIKHCNEIPKDPKKIQSYIVNLSKQKVDKDACYIFLILQASSFGSKAIWMKDNKWQNCSFRRFWEPTATSSRRSHVNPMMPMPGTLVKRVCDLVKFMKGITGFYGDVTEIDIDNNGLVYIDPPYKETTHYGHELDVIKFVNSISNKCFVSEGEKLSNKAVQLSAGRSKGGISGDRNKNKINEEWLNEYN